MAVTARASSTGRSPGAAIIASARAPRPARGTIPCSFSADSAPDELPPGCLDAALASSPAQVTTSWPSAAASALAREKAALRRQRAGATRRSASRTPARPTRPPALPQGGARRPARNWPSRRGSPPPGRPRTCRPPHRHAGAGRRRGRDTRDRRAGPSTLSRAPPFRRPAGGRGSRGRSPHGSIPALASGTDAGPPLR
jgi:hypothetical protein